MSSFGLPCMENDPLNLTTWELTHMATAFTRNLMYARVTLCA